MTGAMETRGNTKLSKLTLELPFFFIIIIISYLLNPRAAEAISSLNSSYSILHKGKMMHAVYVVIYMLRRASHTFHRT